jgi:probable rRNA maturation factor
MNAPVLSLSATADWIWLEEAKLLAVLQRALPLCFAARGAGDDAPLAELTEVELTIVRDAEIAEVHGQFLADPTPTDVITFQHGEILASADTAAAVAATHGHEPLRELALYFIHGLLHLHGHTDAEDEPRRLMHDAQAIILAEVWPQ